MEFTKHDVNAEIRKVYVKKPPYTKKANRDTKEHNARTLPSTVTASELGSSKRNILRKGKKGAARKGSTSGLVVDDGSTYDDSYAVLDKNDPNFDSENDADGRDLVRGIAKAILVSGNTFWKQKLEGIIDEYFVSADVNDFIMSLFELYDQIPESDDFPTYEIVKRTISKSLDQSNAIKENVSYFLSLVAFAHAEDDVLLVSVDTICEGFDKLFEILSELEMDCPTARDDLAKYLARATHDEILPPAYMMELYNDPKTAPELLSVLDKAKVLLSQEHSSSRLDHIWGPGDGRSVEELNKLITQLLEEYLISRQLEEADRCITELSCPFYHHEVVKKGLSLVMLNAERQDCLESMANLFKYVVLITGTVSAYQCQMGFSRVWHQLEDIQLDAPHAATMFADFVNRAFHDGILNTDFGLLEK